MLFFDSIIREDRSLLDLLAADYTFLNERLAAHYKIAGIEGRAMRRVRLDDFAQAALDVARRFHFAFEMLRRQIGACRRETRIEGGHRWFSRNGRRAARRARAPPGSRRLPAGPAWRLPTRRTGRNAARTLR